MRIRLDVVLGTAASALLLGGWAFAFLPFSLTEVLGFITGGISVWLVVKGNLWTWPVGIANNVLFIVLFWRARLYADMGLQWAYVAISIAGWWFWLRGGAERSRRRVARVGLAELVAVLAAAAVATVLLTDYLRSVDDSAPFLDALTTSLSLAAMYLMARKLVENWWLWIAADVIYIPLYVAKELPLTGLLYAVFLAMCVRGLVDWSRSCRAA
jgi:nicotinamide mononucleotide transporter